MLQRFEYTTIAQRFTARFPRVAYVATQASYWTIANLLLVAIVNILAKIMTSQFNMPGSVNLGYVVTVAVIFGSLYGACLGVAEYYLDRNFFRKLSLGKVMLLKAMGSLALLFILLSFFRFVQFDLRIAPTVNNYITLLNEESWKHVFYLLLIYYSFMTLIINFVNQVNRKFGPGVLAPILLGRYRNPREEQRIFMFMDLKSSTTIAEQLGHIKYSAFIRDCFADINKILVPYRAQVYQYVGDEIVLMWPVNEGLQHHVCVRFYFACKEMFQNKDEYYKKNYGVLPFFKAGAHVGKVTAVEIGDIKRDIAYHGDTLNTTARIQSLCNQYNKDFLASEYLITKIGVYSGLNMETIGILPLKGKLESVAIVSVNAIDQEEIENV